VLGTVTDAAAVRGFAARRRAAAAANLASFGGAAAGDASLAACDGVAGESAPPDAAARGACLEDGRDKSTSWASNDERDEEFLRGVTTIGASESDD